MKRDWRYGLRHMGDAFADIVESTVGAALDSASLVVVGLKERRLKSKRPRLVMAIGERAIQMRSKQPDIFANDAQMTEIFKNYDELQGAIVAHWAERQEKTRKVKERLRNVVSGAKEGTAPEGADPTPA